MNVYKLKRWVVLTVGFSGAVLALAGTVSDPLLWAFVAGVSALTFYGLAASAPDLGRERFAPPTRGLDPTALRWIRLTAAATLVAAPLDSGRLHWSAVDPTVRAAALALCLAAFFFCFHAMTVNRFFSAVIRIQDDRGHRVVDRGPYALIRHPGYLGMAAGVPLAAIAVGSWWALVPASLYSLLIVRRAAVEDRFLRTSLPGYDEYAARVTSRLLPGVW
jgi:protein-S-isoprenylcysteine O-methyltransferase Ste14